MVSSLRYATFMYLLALWQRDCSDDSYADRNYNTHCDVTIYLTVRAANLCNRESVEVRNFHYCKLLEAITIKFRYYMPPRY